MDSSEVATPSALGKQLHRAVRENDRGAMLAALDAGADPNWVNPSTSISALHLACKLGYTKLALLLIQRGADVNAQTKTGWAPMHFAVNTGILELVELLHASGGRSDIVNEWMKTPGDIAKERKYDDMVEVLRKKPGSITQRTMSQSAGSDAVSSGSLTPSSNNANNGPSPLKPVAASRGAAPHHNITANQVFSDPLSNSDLQQQAVPMTPEAKRPTPPPKSPRIQAQSIRAPSQEAPLPPINKPLPMTPTEGIVNSGVAGPSAVDSPMLGKSRTGRVDSRRNLQAQANGVAQVTSGDGDLAAEVKRNQAEIARLNKEMGALRGEVDFLKQELERVLTYFQGVDL